MLLLPGVVAFVVPLSLARSGTSPSFSGMMLVAIGARLLALCVHAFFTQGRGTLAPWDPPQHLVTSGPYRWSRNPMYIAVLLIVTGWAVAFASPMLRWYALLLLIAFNVRIRVSEEPWAAATFGEAWFDYRARTPRWFCWSPSTRE